MGFLDKLIHGSYKNEKKPIVFPKTRKEVFELLFRYHKRTLFNVSLMCALFALPTVAVAVLSVIYKSYIPAFLADGSMIPPVADDIELSRVLLEMQVDRLACLILIITNALLFVGVAGGVHVIRKAAWGENVEFWHDYGEGIKQNALRYLIYAVILGISLLFCVFVIGYYSVSEAPAAVKAICMAIAVLQLFIVSGVAVFAFMHADLYKSGLFKEIKNAFILFISYLPVNTGFMILTALPLALLFIPLSWVQATVSVVLTLLFPAYAILIWVLRSDALFDKHLNVGANASVAGKGIVWGDETPKRNANRDVPQDGTDATTEQNGAYDCDAPEQDNKD